MNQYTLDDIWLIIIPDKETWEETLSYVQDIPIEQHGRWWLQGETQFGNRVAFCSEPDGSIGYYIKEAPSFIRPLFHFHSPGKTLQPPGTKILIENVLCTVVGDYTALADKLIGKPHCFDKNAKEFTKSELFEYINSTEFKKFLI